MVIEDSPAIALLLRRRLEMNGFEVEVCGSGAEGLSCLDRGPVPDVILADFSLPGLDGLEVARQVKARHPGLPVILVTASELSPDQYAEPDAVIEKPIEFESLFAAIERSVGRTS